MKKRVISFFILAMSVLSVTACSKKTEETKAEQTFEQTGLANPVEEVTEQEMVEKTGIDLSAPQGAENIAYSVINSDPMLAQLTYNYDGHEFTQRACMTDLTSLTGGVADDPDASAEELISLDFSTGNISGLYYDFTMGATQEVSYCEALTQRSKEGPCYIAWLDVAPGILYNLSCMDALTDQELVKYAEEVFLPMQQDVD